MPPVRSCACRTPTTPRSRTRGWLLGETDPETPGAEAVSMSARIGWPLPPSVLCRSARTAPDEPGRRPSSGRVAAIADPADAALVASAVQGRPEHARTPVARPHLGAQGGRVE